MRLLRLSEAESEATPQDPIFAYSRFNGMLFAVAMLAASGAFVYFGWQQGTKISYCVAGALLLVLMLFSGLVTARFRPTNWLLRMSTFGVYIKFRSYLNYEGAENDEVVVFIPYTEIRSARLLRLRVKMLDPEGHNASQTQRYIEFDLNADCAALAQALAAEVARKAPMTKHWYGKSSSLYNHYPARFAAPSFLEVQWAVVPGWQSLLEALPAYVNIADPVTSTDDFTALSALTREQQEQRLRDLVARGENITAIYTARRLYGCGLAEAKSMIQNLR
jgi:hypothetical protein